MAAVAVLHAAFFSNAFLHQVKAQDEPLSETDLAGLPVFREASLDTVDWAKRMSPDGNWIAYTVQDFRRQVEPYPSGRFSGLAGLPTALACDLWLVATSGGEPRNLTKGVGTNYKPVWSPDGQSLAFISTRDGAARLWVWNARTDSLHRVSDQKLRLECPFDILAWSPDGRSLVAMVMKENVAATSETSTVKVFRGEDQPRAPMSAADLALIDVTSGKVRRLREGALATTFSPQGGHLAILATKPTARIDQPPTQLLIFVVGPDGEPKQLAADLPFTFPLPPLAWSADGQSLAWLVKGECRIAGLDGAAPRRLTPNFSPMLTRARTLVWNRNGTSLHTYSEGKLWRIALSDGTVTPTAEAPTHEGFFLAGQSETMAPMLVAGDESAAVTIADGKVSFWEASLVSPSGAPLKMALQGSADGFPANVREIEVDDDGRSVIFLAQDATHAEDLWIARAGETKATRLTRLNPQFETTTLGATKVIEYTDTNGQARRGLLVLPANFDPKRRYPLIAYVYPGDRGADYLRYFGGSGAGVDNFQFYATHGYAVLYADLSGSRARPAADLAPLVLSAVDAAIAQGLADPERLGLMGHSDGGYATIAILTQTDRFKAAICRAGYANLIGRNGMLDDNGWAYGVTADKAAAESRITGSPWQQREAYLAESPFFHLDRVTTPLLLVHGSNDSAAHVSLADEVFVGLRQLGRKVEYARYEREQHVERFWSYPNQRDHLHRALSWFDQHLKK